MIRLVVEEDQGRIVRFRVSGHAGYADAGQDIVCAAVSVLVTNAINSMERFLQVQPTIAEHGAALDCRIPEPAVQDAGVQLLLRSMVFGVEQTADQYPKNVRIEWRSSTDAPHG
ncbi:MAG: ribosomal-processing cysteine protease Prp [Alicyclobacillus sp.]|nr:ribosomal-processing cysteine protease Prp [Alicyclobacillus sp.]